MTRTGPRARSRERAGAWNGASAVATMFVLGLVSLLGGPGSAGAQELADYDYENLGFRGVGFYGGYIFPSSVKETYTIGASMDLGYLGPGLRVVPSLTYWDSELKNDEVAELEDRLEDLIVETGPPGTTRPDLDLGTITWSDLALTVDSHFVWAIPYGFLGYAGAGASAHLMNGGGSIADTFIDDLLDSIRAGFNLHAGLEVPLHERLRLHTAARYELLGDLRYLELRAGLRLFLGDPVVGEGNP